MKIMFHWENRLKNEGFSTDFIPFGMSLVAFSAGRIDPVQAEALVPVRLKSPKRPEERWNRGAGTDGSGISLGGRYARTCSKERRCNVV